MHTIHSKKRSIALTQVHGLSEFQLHYHTMYIQVAIDQLNLLDHCRSQASVNNWSRVLQVITMKVLQEC